MEIRMSTKRQHLTIKDLDGGDCFMFLEKNSFFSNKLFLKTDEDSFVCLEDGSVFEREYDDVYDEPIEKINAVIVVEN